MESKNGNGKTEKAPGAAILIEALDAPAIKYRVWRRKAKLEDVVLDTYSIQEAYDKMIEVAGKKGYAYITVAWRIGPSVGPYTREVYFLINVLSGEVSTSDLRVPVRKFLGKHR